jgi:hypothetical protein
MNKLVEKQTSGLPANVDVRNPFQEYGEAAGGGHIVGELLKFSKGDWLAGQNSDEIPPGTKLIAAMDTLVTGWQKWQDQRPTDQRLGLLIDGFVPPRRDELGDTDQAMWERDDDGKLRDPWGLTNFLQLVEPGDAEKLFTFTTSSKGGLGAIGKLCRVYGRALAKEQREDQYPVVRLDTGSYAHRDRSLGRIKFPDFAVVGWVDKHDLKPVRDEMGDEIPF